MPPSCVVAVLSPLSLALASLLQLSPTFLSFPAPRAPATDLGVSPSSPVLPRPCSNPLFLCPSDAPTSQRPTCCLGDAGGHPRPENESQSNLPGDWIRHGHSRPLCQGPRGVSAGGLWEGRPCHGETRRKGRRRPSPCLRAAVGGLRGTEDGQNLRSRCHQETNQSTLESP